MKMTRIGGMAASLFLVSTSAFANIVTNADFEAGEVGWTTKDMAINFDWPFVHSGVNAAETGCDDIYSCVNTQGAGAYVGQTLGTAPGMRYRLSFWVGENASGPSALSVFWNGAQVGHVFNPNNYLWTPEMKQFTFSGLLATSANTWFEVHGAQRLGGIFFDDFSVTSETVPVPEPASLTVLLTGLSLLGIVLRRKSRLC